ncbi:hypothetical protein MF672_031640 [Actinomadura sp. ATCC 31491]|uniref:Uncharacterized protein n=1 Tax=Actinomadura luzonensis TaxID=2805427 RepID=A0ABT0G2I1_9ACTN|nr:hypothetical protein [Actinomadura luzonensis]MCK2218311.1 hypothetical protein [Actinomadura luzonensis]
MTHEDEGAGCRARYANGRIILDAWAPGRAECMAQAVRGLVRDAVRPGGAPPCEQDVERVEALPDRELLAHVLGRAVAQLARRGLVPADVLMKEDDEGGVTTTLLLVPGTQLRRMPAAGPRADDVLIERSDAGWRCHVVVEARPVAALHEGFPPATPRGSAGTAGRDAGTSGGGA